MNELDLFAAAVAVTDPDQREARFKRQCAGQAEPRARINRCTLLKNVGKRGMRLTKAATGLLLSELSSSEDHRFRRVRLLQCAVLMAVGLLAFDLAWYYPASRQASSWREKDVLIWHHAYQLFRRDPEELSESELEDVRQWGRCLVLVDRHNRTGLNGLTDDECELVVEALEKLCPNLEEHAGYLPIYEACRRRLADAPAGDWMATNIREEQP